VGGHVEDDRMRRIREAAEKYAEEEGMEEEEAEAKVKIEVAETKPNQ